MKIRAPTNKLFPGDLANLCKSDITCCLGCAGLNQPVLNRYLDIEDDPMVFCVYKENSGQKNLQGGGGI